MSLSELRRMANVPILQHEGQPVWFCNAFFPLKGRLFTRFCPLEARHKETTMVGPQEEPPLEGMTLCFI